MINVKLKPVVLAVAGVLAAVSTAYAADAIKADKVDVISTTPLQGIGLSKDKIPSNIQTATDKDLSSSQSFDLTDYMNRNLTGVYINENQGNPLQSDVNYRGFTASPLLGTPQGMSVYMDGVRLNQPFGDVVSWDLIPKNAIKNIQLMPGSNPLFGLNTLGGALSIQTKDGRNSPGGAAQVTYGSYARKIGEFEYGGVSKDNSVDYFIAGTFFDENGWRDFSSSDSQQLFTKLGWSGEKTDIKLTYAFANTNLNGNGLAPLSFIERDRSSVYTHPDNTKNESHFLNLNWAHYFSDDVSFSANTYYRHIKTKTLNADINDTALPEWVGGTGQTWMPTGATANSYNPTVGGLTSTTYATVLGVGGGGSSGAYGGQAGNLGLCRYEATDTAGSREPGEKCSGLINRTTTKTDNFGITAQTSVSKTLLGKENTYTVGAGFDYSRVRFNQSAEFGSLTLDRGVIGSGFFADQNLSADLDGELDDRSAILKGSTYTYSVFGTDTLSLTDQLHLTASGRYNHVKVENRDQQQHADPEASLTGDHIFSRFNPAVGVVFNPVKTLNTYVGYNEGTRAPTSMELGCANENAPCNLPNSMAGDPPLKQVVSKTWEAGFRGVFGDNVYYSAGVFNTRNQNDIQFISTSNAKGYFDNVGETNRKGIEAALGGKFGSLSLGGSYTYLDATYESDFTANGASNSSSTNVLSSTSPYPKIGQNISVKAGDQIPLTPKNLLKLHADFKVSDKLSFGANSLTVGSSYVRGNENNQHQATGSYYGNGKIPGYTVINLSAAYRVQPDWLVFARVNNVFDREYYTSGMLGGSPFSNSTGNVYLAGSSGRTSTSIGETFVAPGAPRSVWVGVRYEFGGKKTSSVDRE